MKLKKMKKRKLKEIGKMETRNGNEIGKNGKEKMEINKYSRKERDKKLRKKVRKE